MLEKNARLASAVLLPGAGITSFLRGIHLTLWIIQFVVFSLLLEGSYLWPLHSSLAAQVEVTERKQTMKLKYVALVIS